MLLERIPWKTMITKKRRVIIMAVRLLLEDDADKLAALFFLRAFIRSIRVRFLIATSAMSLTNFWSAASKAGPFGGLGGLGGFLEFVVCRFSFTYFLSRKGTFSWPLSLDFLSTNTSRFSFGTSTTEEVLHNSTLHSGLLLIDLSILKLPPKDLLRRLFVREFFYRSKFCTSIFFTGAPTAFKIDFRLAISQF